MSSIFTKTNKKPSKYIISDISNKTNNLLFSLFKKLVEELKLIGDNKKRKRRAI